jgi:hypothetical protein
LQSKRERVDAREELLHIREDLGRLTVSQNRVKDKLQRIKVEKLEKNKAENITNLTWLMCMAVYLRDKAERLRRTWENTDSLRVDELNELNGELPLESQCEIHTETFELH